MGPFEFNYSLKWSRMQPDHYNLNNSLNVALFCLLLLQYSFGNLCPVSMITLDDAPEKHIFSPR